MSLESVIKIVDEGISLGISEYYFVGAGETTLHPEIIDILNYTKNRIKELSRGLTVTATNGLTLANEEFCKKLVATETIIFSHFDVLGTDESAIRTLSKVTGVPYLTAKRNAKLMEQGRRNLLKYSKAKFGNFDKVFFQHCLTKESVRSGQSEKVFQYCYENGLAKHFEIVRSSPGFQRGSGNDLPLDELYDIYNIFSKIEPGKSKTPPAYGKNCHMVSTGIHILANGDALPCCGSYIKIGNVFELSLKDILDSPIRGRFRNYMNYIVGICRKCEDFEYCGAGCRGDVYHTTGCFDASDPYCPKFVEKNIELTRKSIFGDKSCIECDLKSYSGCKQRSEIKVYKPNGGIKII